LPSATAFTKAIPSGEAQSAGMVSVHIALNAETKGLLDAAFFDALRPGAIFINTSRAEVIDQEALARAVREKSIRVGLDVFAKEPASGTGDFADDIVSLPGVYGTHHIGASTEQAQEAIAAETVRIIRSFKDTGRVPNAVNLARSTPATCALVVRHLDRPGVLARVLDEISAAHINVQEMENIVFEGAEAAVARIHLEQRPDDALLQRIGRASEYILEAGLITLD